MKVSTNDELTAALARIDELWRAEPGTPEGAELDALISLVEDYESKHCASHSDPSPIEGKNLLEVLADLEPLGPEDQLPDLDEGLAPHS